MLPGRENEAAVLCQRTRRRNTNPDPGFFVRGRLPIPAALDARYLL